MEPHSHIVHNRKKHINLYVKTYVSICLCGSKKYLLSLADSK